MLTKHPKFASAHWRLAAACLLVVGGVGIAAMTLFGRSDTTNLASSSWQLTKLTSSGRQLTVDQARLTLEFPDDRRVVVKSAFNTCNGTYSTSGKTLRISCDIVTTQGSTEYFDIQAAVRALYFDGVGESVSTYAIRADQLIVWHGNWKYVFERAFETQN